MTKKILIFILPTILLIITILLSYIAYDKYRTSYLKTYISSHQISQRSIINDEDLIEVEVPKEYLSDDVYLNLEDIIGKYVKLSYSIPKGSLIYKGFLENDIKDYANTLLLEGQTNYDIYANEVKVNTNNLCTNMYVDLYVTINSNNKPLSGLLLENCRITGLYDPNNKLIHDYDNDSKVNIISIAINKDEVNILNKAIMLGEINLLVNHDTYETEKLSKINKHSDIYALFE